LYIDIAAVFKFYLIATVCVFFKKVKCLQRWEKVLKPGIVKGRWTTDEDRQLIEIMAENFKSWGKVSELMPGRTSKQCRERWNNYLRPDVVHSVFSEREDGIILSMQEELGNKWALIARALPGRTENAVKVRFSVLVKSRQRLEGHSSSQSPEETRDVLHLSSDSSSASQSDDANASPAHKRPRTQSPPEAEPPYCE
jgi:hypothetical protein